MRHLGPWIVGLLLLGVLGWECYAGNSSDLRWQQDTTTVFQGVQAREDSAEAMLTLARDLFEAAHQKDSTADAKTRRADRQYRSALNLRDSLTGLLTASPDTSTMLQVALQALDSMEAGYRSLKEAFDLQGQALAQMDSAFWASEKRSQLRGESIDSLTALIRRPRGDCKVLGVIPCPSLTVGVSAVEDEGIRTGLGATFGWSIPLGKR